MVPPSRQLNERVQGWLRHLWRKATTPDDWSRTGQPHEWWDRYSLEPMLSFPRFDLSESSYGLLLMGRRTPAWREVYTRILDELVERHTTFWAAIDWLTQFGPDPERASYPKRYKRLIPSDLWGEYDVPGWTANGIEPWGRQPDPIASDGNLFFRGFLTLMLGIHRAVSGQDTWERPFEMAGLDDQTFPWTHSGIAGFLSDQWSRVPHGPHCENTKVWPFCLSAAGLGLQMTDLTTGSDSHGVYDQWVEDFLTKKYMGFRSGGDLAWIGLYYDPILDRVHGGSRAGAITPALYVVPQNREVGELLYRNGVAALGWNRSWLPVLNPFGGEPRMLSLGLLLAREFGDATTERRLGRKLAKLENGRFFGSRVSGESGDEDGDEAEFGYFFGYDEPWPRGQESALLMLRDLLDGEGAWWRAFNESDAEKFDAPTVEGVDYPRVGLSSAWNDSGKLTFETYAATKSAQGEATRFRVTQLPDPGAVQVMRDGATYGGWRVEGATEIEIDSEVAAHRFEVQTGYRPGSWVRNDGRENPASAADPSRVSATSRVRALDLVTASLGISGGGGCPCCVG